MSEQKDSDMASASTEGLSLTEATAALQPFVSFYEKRRAIYAKRGGKLDSFPDTHPSFDIDSMKRELPLGVWRKAAAALAASQGKGSDVSPPNAATIPEALRAIVAETPQNQDLLEFAASHIEWLERPNVPSSPAQQEEGYAELKRVGAMMSNICFNWSQDTQRFTDNERHSLKNMQERWDAAMLAAQPDSKPE